MEQTQKPVEKKPEVETQTQKPVEKKPEVSKAKEKKKNPVDQARYDKYAELKLIDLAKEHSVVKMDAKDIQLMNDLEAELKKCSGMKSRLNVTAAIGNEVVKLIKDIPIPECYEKIIKDAGRTDYYLTK